jgi:hypothetical protein
MDEVQSYSQGDSPLLLYRCMLLLSIELARPIRFSEFSIILSYHIDHVLHHLVRGVHLLAHLGFR